MNNDNTALLLPGGGARAAYQVGAIKALAELTKNEAKSPFPILCGTSAGALNAVGLASRTGSFVEAAHWLEDLWLDLRYDHVYRTDWLGIIRNTWRLFMSLFNSGVAVGRPVGLLDNLPLKEMLRRRINFAGIGENIKAGRLSAVSVTAMNYTEGDSISFFQGGPDNAEWQRWRRHGIPTPIELRHLIASSAIPTIFPPQRIGRNYYGDGALRQLSPISPALHLGANKVLIIAVSGHKKKYAKPHTRVRSPAFGQILGHLLNSAFIDGLETDIEMLERINELIELSSCHDHGIEDRPLRQVDSYVISPSEDIDTLASDYIKDLPSSVRSFLRVTGSGNYNGGVNIASYLLFTEPFCQLLIDMGYRDTMHQRDQLLQFLS